MPTSAIATGMAIFDALKYSSVCTGRIDVIVTRIVRPVIGANFTGAGTTAFGVVRSVIGGRSTTRFVPSSELISSWVGTECRPSATTWRLRWSNVTGWSLVSWTHWSVALANLVLHAVVGSPSNADDPRARASPSRYSDDSTLI